MFHLFSPTVSRHIFCQFVVCYRTESQPVVIQNEESNLPRKPDRQITEVSCQFHAPSPSSDRPTFSRRNLSRLKNVSRREGMAAKQTTLDRLLFCGRLSKAGIRFVVENRSKVSATVYLDVGWHPELNIRRIV